MKKLINRPAYRIGVVALLAMILVVTAGCAVGRKVDYSSGTTLPMKEGSGQLAVGVVDHRPYVVSGDKGATFVGLQRSGVGIPYNVNTQSGRPLASDFSGAISKALTDKGYTVTEVELAPKDTIDAAKSQLGAVKAGRRILLEVREWKTDTYAEAGLFYGLYLDVLDENSAVIGHAETAGQNNLGGSFWDLDPAASAAEVASAAFKRKLNDLFREPAIQTALSTVPPG
jgi:hypothetical protein